MATNYSSPQYTLYLHKGLPAVHLGAPADFFDTRRLVSGGQRGGVVAGRFVFGCRQSFFWLSAGCFLLPASCCPTLSAQTQPPEHKIVVFVLFWPSEPPFSGFSSTKSGFLCAFGLWNPRFQAFRAQNRHFCALFAFGTPVFGLLKHKIGVFVRFYQQVSSR